MTIAWPQPGHSRATPQVWILLSGQRGDDNQLRALAEALGFPFEAQQVRYNLLRRIAFLRGERLWHLTREARRALTPPWPDLVIGLGYASVSISRYIRRQSGGRTRLVHLGNPRTDLSDIDLVLTTPQFPLRPAPNVVVLPLPVGNPAQGAVLTPEEKSWFESRPRPLRLIVVGGSTRQWRIRLSDLGCAIDHLESERARYGGSLIAVTSPRTEPRIARYLRKRLTGAATACVEAFPRFTALLAECDEFYVTADSVSMLSEAVLTRKPVGMIPIARSLRGALGQVLVRLGLIRSKADLSQFWHHLTANHFVGSVDSPVASNASNTVGTAVNAINGLLAQPQGSRLWRRGQVQALFAVLENVASRLCELSEDN